MGGDLRCFEHSSKLDDKKCTRTYIFYQFSVCSTHECFLIDYIVSHLQLFCKGVFLIPIIISTPMGVSQSVQSGKSVENRAERTVFKQLLKPYKLIRRCSHSARISLIGSKLGRRHLYSPVWQGVAAAKSAVKIDAIRAIHFYAL